MADKRIEVRANVQARLRVEVEMAQNEHWWISTDIAVRITVYDRIAKVYLNDATVTGVLKDSNGDAVSGADSIAFAYTAGSNGEYVGNVPDTASIVDGEQYTLVLTAVASAGHKGTKYITRTARKDAA